MDTNLLNELKSLEKILLQSNKNNAAKATRDLILVQNRLYSQIESLSWLQRRLKIKGRLPPLRGWAASPDVLLHLHEHIMHCKPQVIVEFGSGASTLVIADALQQNGTGRLYSIEHSDYYGAQTLETLRAELLEDWVDLRIGDLEPWSGQHLNPQDAEKPSRWYPTSLLQGIQNVDLLWVDGPPGATCLFSRYPAAPALVDRFSDDIQIWLDDTVRQEEKDICERWAADYGFELSYLSFEKGLGVLRRSALQKEAVVPTHSEMTVVDDKFNEQDLGFDFSLTGRQIKG